MYLFNYDFYDLYALLVFFRSNPSKVSLYAEAMKQIVSYMETDTTDTAMESNVIRKILRSHIPASEEYLSWVGVDNMYTANIVIIKNKHHYDIIGAIFKEMLACAGDSDRVWLLCDVTHNIPLLLADHKKPRKVIHSMLKGYQKSYNKDFLKQEVKDL